MCTEYAPALPLPMTLITDLRILSFDLSFIKTAKKMITTKKPPITKYVTAIGAIVALVEIVGASVVVSVGNTVGAIVGGHSDNTVGAFVGVSVANTVGAIVGVSVGNTVSVTVGDVVGTLVQTVSWCVEQGVLMYQPTGQLAHFEQPCVPFTVIQ